MNRLLAVRTLLVLGLAVPALGDTLPLSRLDLTSMTASWGRPQIDKSITGKPLRIGARDFATGVGTHAESEFIIELDGKAEQFRAWVGVDAAAGDARASIEFFVYGDDALLFKSGVCKLGDDPKLCEVPLKGVTLLYLEVGGAGDGVSFDHADWAEAAIAYSAAVPKALSDAPPEDKIILTPPAPPEPRINGPRIYGTRPGSPFLYRIPATGDRPMTFAAENLPEGLSLDKSTGLITGKSTRRGETRVTLIATNAKGSTQREFRIVVGDKLALTPYMGWNTWYLHYSHITDDTLRKAADDMIRSGMADYGYEYVSLDDCWMVKVDSKDPEIGGELRNPDGSLRPNQRFPDMKALTDYIHARGLKAGTYISPGPRTCAGYAGSYQHEAQDARTFADWGFDLLKYDWCSYTEVAGGKTREDYIRPYKLMWDELQKLDRDIIFNLCQYGQDNVWEWGAQVGHSWRTTDDLGWVGGHLSKGIYLVGLKNAGLWKYAGPGHWNDPDYLSIGRINADGGPGQPTPLSPSEQYTHMTMWSLMASPLIFAGDMGKLDPFTFSLLCNHEVLELNQDPLGQQARVIRQTRSELVLLKDLEDGSKAVGLFNLSPRARSMSAAWSELGLAKDPRRARDPWRQQDVEVPAGAYKADVTRHGMALIRFWPAK